MPELSTAADDDSSMLALAQWTGGKAFYNTNDLANAIRRAMEDAEATFTLGFYPEQQDMDEKYHELKVKVARKGLEVRSRQGYFATQSAAPSEKDVEVRIGAAVASPLDSTRVGLKARIEPYNKPEGSFRVTLWSNVSDLDLHNENGRWSGQINVTFALMAADGSILRASNDKLGIGLSDASYQAAQKDGVGFAKVIESFPGLAEIRVVLVDAATGNAGSLHIPLPTPVAR